MNTRTAILVLVLTGRAHAQGLERDFSGPSGARFGEALGPAGDLDGDGFGEVLVGIPGDDGVNGTDSGAVFVYSGASMTRFIRQQEPFPAVLLALEGEAAGDEFGCAVWGVSVGDYDGDGVAELLVGAQRRNGVAGSDCGAVYIISGAWLRLRAQGLPSAPSGVLLIIEGSAADAWFGHVVDGSGDGNADGVLDLAVGAPQQGGVGRVEVISGNWIETAIAGAAVPPEYLWSESVAEPSVAPSPAHFGWSLAWIGDFDQDGDDDLVVGAPSDSSYRNWSGSVRVFSGGNFQQITQVPGGGAAIPDNVGISVAGPGDLNGDGKPEVIGGAPWESPNPSPCGSCCWFSGIVFLFHGGVLWPPSGWDAPYSVQTSGNAAACHSTHLGRSVAGCGDFDGDGFRDVVLGQPDANEPPGVYTHGCGAVAVVRDTLLQSQQLVLKTIGNAAEHHLGSTVAPAGDVNGDGFQDLLAQAAGGDYVRIVLGRPLACDGTVNADCNGNGQDDGCDLALDLSSDCNGNGVPDECDAVLVSAVSPNQGPSSGGNTVAITGAGFVAGATLVLFDSMPATVLDVPSPGLMHVRVPPLTGTIGSKLGRLRTRANVTVSTCVDSTTLFGGYDYVLPLR